MKEVEEEFINITTTLIAADKANIQSRNREYLPVTIGFNNSIGEIAIQRTPYQIFSEYIINNDMWTLITLAPSKPS